MVRNGAWTRQDGTFERLLVSISNLAAAEYTYVRVYGKHQRGTISKDNTKHISSTPTLKVKNVHDQQVTDLVWQRGF